VLDKAVDVLDCLVSGPKTLAELVAATGLPRATAHRLAVALEHHDLVRRDGEGRFALGFRLTTLGRAALDSSPLADLARTRVWRAADTTEESVQVVRARGATSGSAIESLESPHGLRTIVAVGAALSLAAGSAGQGAPPASRSRRAAGSRASEEREAGVASVSAPIRDRHGDVIAAIGVSGRSSARRDARVSAMAPASAGPPAWSEPLWPVTRRKVHFGPHLTGGLGPCSVGP